MKRWLRAFLFLTAIILGAFTLCGCVSPMEKYDDSISELREQLLVGSSDGFSAELISGYREQPFSIDGERAEITDYALLTVTPVDFTSSASLKVKIVTPGAVIAGEAVRHPFENSYSFEVFQKINCDTVNLSVDGFGQAELKSVKKGEEISASRALEIALDNQQNAISEYKNGSKFTGEIFIRLINNPLGEQDKCYWYVSLVPKAEPERIIAVLINVVSGEVEARRER